MGVQKDEYKVKNKKHDLGVQNKIQYNKEGQKNLAMVLPPCTSITCGLSATLTIF